MSTGNVVLRVPKPVTTMMKSLCLLLSASLAAFVPRGLWNTKKNAYQWRSVRGLAAGERSGMSVGVLVLSRVTTTRTLRSAHGSVCPVASVLRGRWI